MRMRRQHQHLTLPLHVFHHSYPHAGHLDFIWGYNAAEKVYKKVLQTLVDGRPQS